MLSKHTHTHADRGTLQSECILYVCTERVYYDYVELTDTLHHVNKRGQCPGVCAACLGCQPVGGGGGERHEVCLYKQEIVS